MCGRPNWKVQVKAAASKKWESALRLPSPPDEIRSHNTRTYEQRCGGQEQRAERGSTGLGHLREAGDFEPRGFVFGVVILGL